MICRTTDKPRGMRFSNFVQVRTIIDEESEQVWAGKKSAKEALRQDQRLAHHRQQCKRASIEALFYRGSVLSHGVVGNCSLFHSGMPPRSQYTAVNPDSTATLDAL